MPLTDKGQKIMSSMKSQYGSKKGESVFYAFINKGKVTGAHRRGHGGGGGSAVKFRKREGGLGDL